MRWDVDIEIFSPELELAGYWPRVHDRPGVSLISCGFRDEPEGIHAHASLLVDAPDESGARELGAAWLGEAAEPGLGGKVTVRPEAPDDESEPAEFDSRLEPAPWHRSEPVGDGRTLKVLCFTGMSALERIDVEETDDRVTITLQERHTSGVAAAAGEMRCIEVPLQAPLGDRDVYDGATGERPADIVPGNYLERGARAAALAIDLATYPCAKPPP